jgi:hypothetical protein
MLSGLTGLRFPQSIWVALYRDIVRKKRMIGESIQIDQSFDAVRLDWQPIERHPRPFRKKNPNDFGRSAFRFALSLSHVLF